MSGHRVQAADFLGGGGEMGKLIASMDWAKTPLGPIASWPQSLRSTVSLCLASNFPISLIWGPQHIQLYNDGYWPICGGKHPTSMGQDFTTCWASAWPVIGSAFERALAGEASYLENQRIFVDRNGYLEETFFTFSFSPIRDETGGVGGLFHPVTEQTGKMLSERRTRTLRDLSARIGEAKTIDDVFALAAQTLAEFALDLPFVLIYRIEPDERTARLTACCGLARGTPASLDRVDLRGASSPWPFAQLMTSPSSVQLDELERRFGGLSCGPYPEAPKTAILLPITMPGSGRPGAIVVAGVSPRLSLTEDYRGFLDLLGATVAGAVNSAWAREEDRRRADALAELDRAKTAFFSNVSHEFRTPLTLMLAPIEDALDDSGSSLPPAQRARLEVAHRNAQRLLKLVNSLLDFSRIEAGRANAHYQATDLAALTAELASNFRSACEKGGLQLVVDCSPLAEPVQVDRDMWEKIVLNLVSNAFKFTFEGEIAVTLRALDGGGAELAVRDTGIGISEQELPRLFERFHRVEGARGRTHEGTGIGLALVQELAKLHDGTLSVESAVGRGSVFRVAIPGRRPKQGSPDRPVPMTAIGAAAFVEEALLWLPDDAARGASTRTASHEPSDTATSLPVQQAPGTTAPRVVLADDNSDMRAYVSRILEEGGYEVCAVADGEAALAAIRRDPQPDLVLSDVMMPRLDGFGLLAALRSDPTMHGISVILLSARAGEEARIEGLDAGADDYIVKPFGAHELRARVDGAVRLARLRRDAAARDRDLGAYKTLMQHANDAILMLDPDGVIRDANNEASALLDRPHEQIVGQALTAFIEPDQIADLRRLLEAGTMKLGELRLRRDSGGQLSAEVSSAQVSIGDDRVVLLIVRDITARQQLERELRRSEERFRMIVDGVRTHAIFMLDPVGNVVTWSPGAERIKGYRAEEIIGENFSRFYTPEDMSSGKPQRELKIAVEQGYYEEEGVRVRKDGSRFWVVVTITPIYDHTARLIGFVKITRDITESRRTQEALRAAEERFRLLIEGVSDHAIFMLDPTGVILTWSSGAERIDGYASDEIIGRHYSCLFTPESVADGKPAQELEIAAKTGKADVEGWRIRKDGSRFWATGTLAALYDDHGEVQGFAKVTRDLTAKRRNDELLHSVLNHTLDGIISIDEQGTVSMINRAGQEIFGRSEAEVVGQNVNILMPEPYHAEHDGYLANYMRGGNAKITGIGREVRGLRKDGSTFPIDLAVTEFRLESQRYFVGIVRDISERKRLEAQLHQSQKMDAFGQLAGGVAHDFNNILTVISGNSDMLLEDAALADQTREMGDEIRDAAKRAASLTRQLLAFSRQQVLEPRILDLNAVVTNAEKMLGRLIGEDVRLVTTLRPTISSVKADPGQLEQVILNLAVNARDAMPQGGKLTIETSDFEFDESYTRAHPDALPGRYVMMAVSDTGSGMTADVKAHLFEPFFTTKGVGKGTGLGLAVVHGIVKQSGGTIDAYSEVGVGTTFKVYLPAVEQGQAATASDDGAGISPRGPGTILLVEDEDGVRKLVARALKAFGYAVLTASDGKAAIEIMECRREQVDLLVTDVVMPEMSGRSLAETLRADDPSLKVLFLSGYTDDAVVRHGVLQANVNFLQKPFTLNALARKVREILDRE